MEELVLTPAAVLDFLSQIDELRDYNIDFSDSGSGNVIIQIGESAYSISATQAEPLEVDDYVIDTVGEVYDEALNTSDIELLDEDPVESGIISTTVKALAIGGMVLLTGKLLKS